MVVLADEVTFPYFIRNLLKTSIRISTYGETKFLRCLIVFCYFYGREENSDRMVGSISK